MTEGDSHEQSFLNCDPHVQVRRVSVCVGLRRSQRDAAQCSFRFGADECRSVGGGCPVGGDAKGSGGEDFGRGIRSGLHQHRETARNGGCGCPFGSAPSALGRRRKGSGNRNRGKSHRAASSSGDFDMLCDCVVTDNGTPSPDRGRCRCLRLSGQFGIPIGDPRGKQRAYRCKRQISLERTSERRWRRHREGIAWCRNGEDRRASPNVRRR